MRGELCRKGVDKKYPRIEESRRGKGGVDMDMAVLILELVRARMNSKKMEDQFRNADFFLPNIDKCFDCLQSLIFG